MTDYERGVEQASAIYKEVIREYAAENEKFLVKLNAEHIILQNVEIENAKLRRLAYDMIRFYRHKLNTDDRNQREAELLERARELCIEESNDEIGMEGDV